MSMISWSNLEGKDIAAFVGASLVGYFAGSFMPAGAWEVYTSILVSYHLFLVWLVITAEHETGISLPIASMVTTHLACLAIIMPLGIAHRFVPFFGILRYGIASLAIFERTWLFSGKGTTSKPKQEAPIATTILHSTADDYQEWLRYLAQQKPGSREPGSSLKTEYEQWLLARSRTRAAAASSANEQQSGS